MITDTEIEVLSDWIARGIQIVPYKLTYENGKKKPAFPDFWAWKKNPDKWRVKSIKQLHHFVRGNWLFSFRLEDANATMADFDNLLDYTEEDFQKSGCASLDEFVQQKKHEFQSLPEGKRTEMIVNRIKAAESAFLKVCPIISSSGKSIHVYQRGKGEPFRNISTPHIEIFSNNKLGFVADWEGMQDFWDLPVYDYEDIGNYWVQINNELQQGMANITPISLNAPSNHSLRSGSYGKQPTTDQFRQIFKALRTEDKDLALLVKADLMADGFTDEQIEAKFEWAESEIENEIPYAEKIKHIESPFLAKFNNK